MHACTEGAGRRKPSSPLTVRTEFEGFNPQPPGECRLFCGRINQSLHFYDGIAGQVLRGPPRPSHYRKCEVSLLSCFGKAEDWLARSETGSESRTAGTRAALR